MEKEKIKNFREIFKPQTDNELTVSSSIKVLVVCKYPEGSSESAKCRILNEAGFDFVYSWKNSLKPSDLNGVRLVISIGGDGTALSASHYLLSQPLLAVNSAPETSVGALTTISLKELPAKLNEIKAGKYKTENLERISVFINGEIVEPIALNEVFVGNEKGYLISKYKIKFNGNEEFHKSSGLIFASGTGSTAWFKSAGGKPFAANSRYIKMLVREPYMGYKKEIKYQFTEKTIGENEEIYVVPSTSAILAVDSIREFHLKPNDEVAIKISNHPLKRIV
jgi:NAD kinase